MATNLLPPTEKQELISEKLRRKVIFVMFLVLLDLLLLVGILLGLYIYIAAEDAVLSDQVAQKEQLLEQPQSQEARKTIEVANQNLNKISSIKKEQVSSASILEKLNELLPGTAYLTSFSFQNATLNNKNIGKIRLSGLAGTRETVFLFKNLLSQNQSFQDIYFEPSSWIKSVNADFIVEFNFIP